MDLLKTEMYEKFSLLGEIWGDITQMLCHLNISFLTSSIFVCEFNVNKGSFNVNKGSFTSA